MRHNIDSLNVERDADAYLAKSGCTLFKNLKLGERFAFTPSGPKTLVRTLRGYRDETTKQQFQTGTRTACFP